MLSLALADSAAGRSFIPRHHRIFHGVSDTTNNEDFHRFKKRVGAHPAVLQDFYHWDTPLTSGALQRWRQTRTRGVLSLSTAPGGQPEIISTRQIAKGRGDHYIVRLNQTIAESKQVVYIRLFPEMNGYWNPYCAFNADGTKKDRSHSAQQLPPGLAADRLDHPRRQAKDDQPEAAPAPHAAHPAGVVEPRPDLRARARGPAPPAPEGRLHVVAADDRLALRPGQPTGALLARQALRRLGRRRHLLGLRDARSVGGVQALLPQVAPLAVRGRRILALGQRLPRPLHPQAVQVRPAAPPNADADLLPQRQPRHPLRHRQLPSGKEGPAAHAQQAPLRPLRA